MKKIIFFTLIFLSLFISACNKQEQGEVIVKPKTKRFIDRITHSNGSTFKNYIYDSQGRCIRSDNDAVVITYTYTGNTITETWTPTNTAIAPYKYTHTLNAQGLTASRTFKSSTNTVDLIEYEYNNAGQLIKRTEKEVPASSATKIKWIVTSKYDNDGDLVSETYEYLPDPTFNSVYIYTVDKTHIYTIGKEYSGLDWQGKSSNHAILKYEVLKNGKTTETISFNNTYDSEGYITRQITTTPNGTFTYNYIYKTL